MICSRFPGYRFEDVDELSPDDVIDLAASCLFLSEAEAQTAKTKGK